MAKRVIKHSHRIVLDDEEPQGRRRGARAPFDPLRFLGLFLLIVAVLYFISKA